MDSKYAFFILYAHASIWKERGMLSARSSPIKHKELILRLLEAVRLPAKLAVIHCKGHQKGQEEEAQGNRKADQEAKWAASYPCHSYMPPFPQGNPNSRLYPRGTFPICWAGLGNWVTCVVSDWSGPNNTPWLSGLENYFLHKSTHFGKDNLETLLKPILYYPLLAKVVRSHRIVILV